jgi:hypothetical protein
VSGSCQEVVSVSCRLSVRKDPVQRVLQAATAKAPNRKVLVGRGARQARGGLRVCGLRTGEVLYDFTRTADHAARIGDSASLSRSNMIGHWKVIAAFARTEKSGDL